MASMLTPEFINLVNNPINNVWQTIGSDLYAVVEECGDTLGNEEAIECCIDANRLTMYGHKDAENAIDNAVKQHGYGKVHKYLCKNIKLA